jgi:hypothetical protein
MEFFFLTAIGNRNLDVVVFQATVIGGYVGVRMLTFQPGTTIKRWLSRENLRIYCKQQSVRWEDVCMSRRENAGMTAQTGNN